MIFCLTFTATFQSHTTNHPWTDRYNTASKAYTPFDYPVLNLKDFAQYDMKGDWLSKTSWIKLS